MLLRSLGATLAAARVFSTKAAKVTTLGLATEKKGAGGRDTLGRRLLSLVYAKRSAAITIRKWKEEGHTVHKYELNRIVRELRKLKRYKHALEVCEWMELQYDIKLVSGDYAVHLDLISKIRGLSTAENFFENLPDKMRGPDTCSALLHSYVQNKKSAEAEALMEKMSECGFLKCPLPYNHMLNLYISNGQLDKVPQMLQELKKNTSPDVVTYNLWLAACASQNDKETAEKAFLELKKTKIDPDWISYSTLTSLYIKMELPEKAATTLKEMEKRTCRKNRVAYSSLLSLYTNMGYKDEVLRIWKKMMSLFTKMNDAEYTCVISSLVKLGEFEKAENIYDEWESVSGTGDPRVPNILLAAYINRNQLEMAESFYNRLVTKGIKPCYTTWELLTWGYLRKGQMEKVLECFKKAIGSVRKWVPDHRLITAAYNKLEEQGDIDGAEHLLVTLRNAGHVSTEIYNSLLRTYAKAGKMPLIIVERMQKDNVQMDADTQKLLKITSEMLVSEVSSIFS